eukprot:CAMPEP_0171108798 /NCGR_PEP_ID=MMETSP0766_2-20121228/69630_1 /TAXON_ID=439317 /ORGANISM="Gambierdiscus australes, Strain CAWD 149" /LENGTH=54 /DNA_ID=CAMNT_0011570401 /DNA_START=78 /DNA_END=242 /DNA_ORIENTATION=+
MESKGRVLLAATSYFPQLLGERALDSCLGYSVAPAATVVAAVPGLWQTTGVLDA